MKIGDQINTASGRYKVESLLGKGNFGVVFLVLSEKDRTKYAVKELKQPIPLREEEILNKLRTKLPHVMQTLDIFTLNERKYIMMQCCEKIRYKYIPNEQFISTYRQIATGIQNFHNLGLIHRDIKPENIVRLGNEYMITDFGTATQYPSYYNGVGTPYYMAPETYSGISDQKVDVFALGCVMYEMYTSQRLFDGKDAIEVKQSVLSSDPTTKMQRCHLRPEFKELILAMVEKKPEKRIDLYTVIQRLAPPQFIQTRRQTNIVTQEQIAFTQQTLKRNNSQEELHKSSQIINQITNAQQISVIQLKDQQCAIKLYKNGQLVPESEFRNQRVIQNQEIQIFKDEQLCI